MPDINSQIRDITRSVSDHQREIDKADGKIRDLDREIDKIKRDSESKLNTLEGKRRMEEETRDKALQALSDAQGKLESLTEALRKQESERN
ncbi:MAG: hypothetical protein MRY49_03105 [Candidatus Pacebacteria bacterium]|nr:hypothetical protein [Candidatus Paceibacterota bacterium]